MRRRIFGRLGRVGWLVVAGVAMSAVVAAIALASSTAGPPVGTPPNPGIAPAGTLQLGTLAPFSVSSAQFGVGVGIGGHPRVASAPSLSEFVVTRQTDAASSTLLQDVTHPSSFPTAVLTLSWGNGITDVYTMTNVLISGWSQSTGGGQPSESVSLNFQDLNWKFTDASGSTSGSYTAP